MQAKVQTDSKQEPPKAVVHVDLDGASHIFRYHGWRYEYADDPLFETGMKNVLSFLNHNKLKATLFTISSDLGDAHKREFLRQAVYQGHEIASHSLTHPKIAEIGLDEKRVEIAESREKLEMVLETAVTGFRAPGFQVDRDCLELLDEYGYRYDSSVFPTSQFAKCVKTSIPKEGPHRPLDDRSIIELPLPKYRPAPFPFHASYSLILGNGYFERGLERFRRTRLPLVLLFHLTDFSEPLPRERLRGIRSKLYTLSHLSAEIKMARCEAMLDRVREHYQIIKTNCLVDHQSQIL